MKKPKILVAFITILTLLKSILSSSQYNVQTISLIKPKQTDCGVTVIDEDYNELVNIYTHEDIFKNSDEDENIDTISKNDKKKTSSKIIKQKLANLSACISDDEIENHYTAFTTRLSSKITRSIFEANFFLDEKRGLLYTKNKIDREKICAHVQKLSLVDKRSNEKNAISFINSKYTSPKSPTDSEESIDCECKSEICELRFKFVAFKDENTKTTKLSKSFKYLYLTVKINDLNDQTPKFKEKFIYLNISENMGESVSYYNPSIHKTNECKQIGSSLINNDFANLIPIDRAFDLDSKGPNSQIEFVLYMFKNISAYFIPLIELEKSEAKRDFMIKNAMNTQITKCGDMFELVDSGEMLFIKVNTHLDREKQDVYNFILIASDANNLEDFSKIRNRNFVLIKLVVNDLNDNQPVFTESKYVFDIKEAVQFDEFYSSFNNDFEYYANLLEQTCLILKNRIKVNALDNDYGFNSLIKYKIVQQVYRKNVHTSYSTHPYNAINIKNKHINNSQQQHEQHDTISLYTKPGTDNIDEDSLFYIDENDGTVSLVACIMPIYAKNLTRNKFLELTSLLDYEIYSKHILLIEARDSNPYNSLQAVVTLEINLIDVNDNPPMLTGIFDSKCTTTNRPQLQSESNENNFEIKSPNVSIQYFNIEFDNFYVERNQKNKNYSYSTVIIIQDYSEFSGVGDCIGQFLINDLDTSKQNRHIDVTILDSSDLFAITRLNDDHDLHASQKRRSHQSDQIYSNQKFELFLKFSPDAEQKRFYDLTLLLTDNGAPFSFKSYAQVKILIKDENDNEPQFAKKNYNLSINEWNQMLISNPENSTQWENECFGRIEAYDSDVTQANSIIYYRLKEIEIIKGHKKKELYNNHLNTQFSYINLDKNFYINKTTGDICVRNKKMVDREIRNKYEFLITASNEEDDTASEIQLKSSAILQINILDSNDNAPEFLQKSFTFYVSEEDSNIVNSFILDGRSIDVDSKSPQYSYNILVGHIGAFDKDFGLNAELKYFTQRNDQLEVKFKSYFELNTENLDNPLLNDKDNIYLSSSDLSELQSVNFKEDSLNVEYKVTAIRHTETGLNFNSSLISKTEAKPKFYPKSSKQNRRLFKPIENLDKYVYVNPETGTIYLINRIDREQILSIRFYLFASDRMGEITQDTENMALKNSVLVTIEIEDVNDSQPVCFAQSITNLKFDSFVHALDVYSIQIDLNALGMASLYPEYQFAPFYSKNTRLIQVYQFECIDNDKNKNSELIYEIESFYLKRPPKQQASNRPLNPAFVNEFILNRKIFSLNANSGILYLNLSKTWLEMKLNGGEENLTEFSVEEEFLKFLKNKFLIIKIKISDKGIVALSTYYYLKFFLCFRTDLHSTQQNYQHEVDLEKKYCKHFETGNGHSNEDNLNSPLMLRALLTETSDSDLANIEMDRESETYNPDIIEKFDDISNREIPNLSIRLNTNRDMSSGFGQTSVSTRETISSKNTQDIYLNSFVKLQVNNTFLFILAIVYLLLR